MATALRPEELRVLQTAIRLNTIVTAATMGVVSGAAVWLATMILVAKGGPDPGAHLSLLSVFMAGYSVTTDGAWAGFIWGFVYGALSGGILYWTYSKSMRANLVRALSADAGTSPLQAPVLQLSGISLGTGLGIVVALQLLAATAWLVMSGRAPYSENAALLMHYLPGYRVTILGAVVGAAELFVLALLAALLVSSVYNAVTRARHRP